MPESSGQGGGSSFDGVLKEFPTVTNGEYTKEGFIQQCAMTLFCNTNFDLMQNESESTIAKKCYKRAEILANLIFK